MPEFDEHPSFIKESLLICIVLFVVYIKQMFINMVIITKNVKEIVISFLFIFVVTLSPSYAQNIDNLTNSTTNNSTLPFALAGDLRVKPNSSNDEDFLCS